MEFLRFGSSIPGSYWGCCAADIIQDFNQDPDAKSSIEMVTGDSGTSNGKFAGPTYRDIFETRIRCGTFETRDMPNHAFLVFLTESQVNGSIGSKWLAILKANGFEFIRTVCNSVYGGASLSDTPGNAYQNYMFALFRNIGNGNISDPFTPPQAWRNLPATVPEAWESIKQCCDENDMTLAGLADLQREKQRAIWDNTPEKKFLTHEEVIAAGAPVILAGKRGGRSGIPSVGFPQQEESQRASFIPQIAKLAAAMVNKKPTVSLRNAPDLSVLAPPPPVI